MSGVLFYLPTARQLSITGDILPGWKAQFYVTETTTPAPVYSDGDLQSELTNPVEADGSGAMPPIYMDPAVVYRVQILDEDDVLIEDVDPFDVSRSASGGARSIGRFTATSPDTTNTEGVASVDWDSGSPGTYTITFTGDLFATTPIITATTVSTESSAVAEISNVSASSFIVSTRNTTTGSLENRAFHFHAFEIAA